MFIVKCALKQTELAVKREYAVLIVESLSGDILRVSGVMYGVRGIEPDSRHHSVAMLLLVKQVVVNPVQGQKKMISFIAGFTSRIIVSRVSSLLPPYISFQKLPRRYDYPLHITCLLSASPALS